jgi:hypothetical protein
MMVKYVKNVQIDIIYWMVYALLLIQPAWIITKLMEIATNAFQLINQMEKSVKLFH